MMPQFILASASPARRRLLQMAGIEPIALPSHFDEDQVLSQEPILLVKTLALRKAEIIANQLAAEPAGVPRLVLGCDSVLAIHGEIHGKPETPAEALARWQQMRGHVGQLVTGHALFEIPAATGDVRSLRHLLRHQTTQVYFAQVSDREIEAYIATGEPMCCAGCFTLEAKGSPFIEKIDGCYSNVLGLSMPLLRQMMAELGYDITDFWQV